MRLLLNTSFLYLAMTQLTNLQASELTQCLGNEKKVSEISITVHPPHQLIGQYLISPWTDIIYQPTNHSTIFQYLTFDKNDTFNEEEVKESVRNLRSAKFIWDANYKVTTLSHCSNKIHINVYDSLPFKPKLSLSKRSGETKSTIGITTNNLFGTGQRLELFRKSSKLRSQNILRYYNYNIGDTDLTLDIFYSNNSDGKESKLVFGKPFYELDSKKSFLFNAENFKGDLKLFDLKKEIHLGKIDTANYLFKYAIGNGSEYNYDISRNILLIGNNRTNYTQLKQFNRDIYSLGYAYELIDRNFVELRNIRSIAKTEDYNTGSHLTLGFSALYDKISKDFGINISMAHQKTTLFDEYRSIKTDINFQGSYFSSTLDEYQLLTNVQYNHFSEKFNQSWNVKLSFDHRNNPKPENHIIMDEEFGIRGFSYGHALGNSALKLNVEKRWLNRGRYFDVLEVASVVFFDSAVIQLDNSQFSKKATETIQSIGAGLRISPTSLSNGTVLHMDIAFPINSNTEKTYELSFHAKRHF